MGDNNATLECDLQGKFSSICMDEFFGTAPREVKSMDQSANNHDRSLWCVTPAHPGGFEARLSAETVVSLYTVFSDEEVAAPPYVKGASARRAPRCAPAVKNCTV